MTEIYEKYGYYKNILLNFTFEGESGMEKMGAIMTSLREHAPEEIAGMKVIETCRSPMFSHISCPTATAS